VEKVKMKKRLLLITILFIIGLVFVYFITNPKVEKWTYDLLPNNYVIKKTSSTNVVLGKYIDGLFEVKEADKQIGIEDYIAEFKYGEKYIALKCLEPDDDSVLVKFYIIDSENDNIYGPYQDEETYNAVADKIIDEELNDWIKTITMPDGAVDK
jgi:hypothetical protein